MRIGIFHKKKPKHLAGPELYRELISEHAPINNATLLDVGCMWGVDGGYAFHAADHGAVGVVGVDIEPATPKFMAENEKRGNPVRFVRGNIDDPNCAHGLGCFDVVFCAGVIYHVPNPVLTLTRLHSLCRRTLILAAPSFPEQPVPQTVTFLPFMDEESRRKLTYPTQGLKRGLDSDYVTEKGYGNWFWAFSPSALRAMLRIAGFDTTALHNYGRLICVVAQPKNVELAPECTQ